MREIKFRVWKDYSARMEFFSFDDLMGFDHWDKQRLLDVNASSPMQYTGIKDKNGVDIYEGDIVMCYPEEIELCYTKVVEWDENKPNLGITTNGRSGATLCKGNQDILEVVGNIHQSNYPVEAK